MDELPEDADTRPVTILRTDAIDAAGALTMLAYNTRRETGRRRWRGAQFKAQRAHMREQADDYEAAARRVQRAADEAA